MENTECKECKKTYPKSFPECPHCYCKKDYLSGTFFECLPWDVIAHIGKYVPLHPKIYSVEFYKAARCIGPVYSIQFDNLEEAKKFWHLAQYPVLYITEFRPTPYIHTGEVAKSVDHALKILERQKPLDNPDVGPARIAENIRKNIEKQENLKKIKTESEENPAFCGPVLY